jgi:hypothetical protein
MSKVIDLVRRIGASNLAVDVLSIYLRIGASEVVIKVH